MSWEIKKAETRVVQGASEKPPQEKVARRKTIFDQKEKIERKTEWNDSPEARLQDFFEIVPSELPLEQQQELSALLVKKEQIEMADLEKFFPDKKKQRQVAKGLAIALQRKIITSSSLERAQLFFTESPTNDNAFFLARALRWFSKNTGQDNLHVVYPASGSDSTGWLKNIGQTPTKIMFCVSMGGPAGEMAPRKVEAQGKKAKHILKSFENAIRDGDIAPNSVDAIILDDWGAGTFVSAGIDFDETLRKILKPGGIIIATNNVPNAIEDMVSPEKYCLLAQDARGMAIIERKAV